MVVLCAVAVLALSNHHAAAIDAAPRGCLAVGDALGMELVQAHEVSAVPVMEARSVRLSQARQAERWWNMPCESTVLVRRLDR